MFFMMIAGMDEDDKAFMLDLYQTYCPIVRKTIYGILQSPPELDDLTNDTFVRLIEKISVLRALDCCKTAAYVVYTSRSVAINFIKHRDVQNKHILFGDEADAAEDLADPDGDFVQRIALQDEAKYLCDVISKLPERQRDLLYFKYVLELTDEKIAENLGITPQSVRQYLTRARRAARALAKEEMSTYAL